MPGFFLLGNGVCSDLPPHPHAKGHVLVIIQTQAPAAIMLECVEMTGGHEAADPQRTQYPVTRRPALFLVPLCLQGRITGKRACAKSSVIA